MDVLHATRKRLRAALTGRQSVTYEELVALAPEVRNHESLKDVQDFLEVLGVELATEAPAAAKGETKEAPEDADDDEERAAEHELRKLNDPLRMYFSQLDRLPLLSREEEAVLGQEIEESRSRLSGLVDATRLGNVRVVELFEAYKVSVHAAMPPPDGTIYHWENEEDIETLRMELWQSRKENKMRGQMVRLGHMQKRLEGGYSGGKLPYGIRYVRYDEEMAEEKGKPGEFQEIPEEVRTLRTIVESLTQGLGLQNVAKLLNSDLDRYPLPTKRAKTWWDQTIRTFVIKNFYFTGVIKPSDDSLVPVDTGIKLFTEEEIREARRKMADRTKYKKNANHEPVTQYLLAGFLKCGE